MRFAFIVSFLLPALKLFSQGCCSGGSGSPIAGGVSQGVFQEHQMEVAINYQYFRSEKFMVGDRDTAALFDNLNSNYLYGRIAYGITDKLTVSIESGYFISKTQYGLEKTDTITSSGIADLILFPRYSIYNRNTEHSKTEITDRKSVV